MSMLGTDGPLYRVVARKIEARIVSGAYAAGAALPPEPALEREFSVSRITIRQALGILKRRGLLYSRSGVGTLVRPSGPAPSAMRMTGSIADLVNYGSETEYRALDREVVTPPVRVLAALGLPRGAPVVRFRGLRSRPGAAPFGLEEVYIPEALGRALDNRALGGRTFFACLEEVHGVEVVEVHQAITAVAAPAEVRRHLGLAAGRPMLRATRTYQIADGRTVEVAVSHYDVSQFEYVMALYKE